MKIGILTFTNTLNYGAILQSFALQEKLFALGKEPEIIQFTNQRIEEKEYFSIKSYLTLKKIISWLILGKGMARKKKKFENFALKNLIIGKNLNSTSHKEINEYYDKFVAGSDQVWNISITHQDWNYFLSFVEDPHKKISYAPSFGNDVFPADCKKKASELLKDFHSLSVRETSGQKIISELIGLKAQVVVDPSLLLSKEEWERHINFKPDLEHYILVYIPHNKHLVFNFVKRLQEKTKFPVVYLSISPRYEFGVQTILDASPDEFLGWVQNADYVVTGSFHGVAFSLNFEKQFFYEPLATDGFEGRIENLVRMTGTEDRSIGNKELDLEKKIDYSSTRFLMGSLREESQKWLERALI